jgi:hypothetical protein
MSMNKQIQAWNLRTVCACMQQTLDTSAMTPMSRLPVGAATHQLARPGVAYPSHQVKPVLASHDNALVDGGMNLRAASMTFILSLFKP